MVTLVPERLARRLASAAGVTVTEPPFGTITLTEAAWWHPMYAADPALAWLRGVVREVAAARTSPAPFCRDSGVSPAG
jgi:DNA-binding transcriptional LysR family regulator